MAPLQHPAPPRPPRMPRPPRPEGPREMNRRDASSLEAFWGFDPNELDAAILQSMKDLLTPSQQQTRSSGHGRESPRHWRPPSCRVEMSPEAKKAFDDVARLPRSQRSDMPNPWPKYTTPMERDVGSLGHTRRSTSPSRRSRVARRKFGIRPTDV